MLLNKQSRLIFSIRVSSPCFPRQVRAGQVAIDAVRKQDNLAVLFQTEPSGNYISSKLNIDVVI